MAATIAASVGSSDASPKPPKTKLIECLRHKTMLLVLDNLEQIRDAAPLVAELLAECPGLCILATSRERLHLRAEQRYQVPPLDLARGSRTCLSSAPQAVDADFVLTAAESPNPRSDLPTAGSPAIGAGIVCGADRSALACPTPGAPASRRLDLLVEGAHDLPPRQRTLRTAIQHSYALAR